jgi:hypothetical protein
MFWNGSWQIWVTHFQYHFTNDVQFKQEYKIDNLEGESWKSGIFGIIAGLLRKWRTGYSSRYPEYFPLLFEYLDSHKTCTHS